MKINKRSLEEASHIFNDAPEATAATIGSGDAPTSASFADEKLSMISGLYKDPKKGTFSEKSSQLVGSASCGVTVSLSIDIGFETGRKSVLSYDGDDDDDGMDVNSVRIMEDAIEALGIV